MSHAGEVGGREGGVKMRAGEGKHEGQVCAGGRGRGDRAGMCEWEGQEHAGLYV